MGVISAILVMVNPSEFNARIADSRPGPGPFTCTSRVSTPYSFALFPAFSAATCAAKGVPLREPLNPQLPALDQDKVLPCISVIVITVLLKEATIFALPCNTLRLAFLRCRATGAPAGTVVCVC